MEEPQNAKSNYWLNTLILSQKESLLKNSILKILNKNKIMSRPLWKPLHTLKHLRKYPKMNLDECENLYKRVINIPSSPILVKKI